MDLIQQAFDSVDVVDPANADAVAEILDRYKLRWTADKLPLHLPNGSPTGYFGITRSDNNRVLNVVKDSYTPMQNSHLAEMLVRISERTGFKMHSGGSFNFGGKVFIQLETGSKAFINGHEVIGYITAINSHDGSSSLKWGVSNYTISCSNTYAAAQRQLANSLRHTSSILKRVDDYLRSIDVLTKEEHDVFEKFKRLSEKPLHPVVMKDIIGRVAGFDDYDQATVYEKKKAHQLISSISAEVKSKGDTMWGLFSGVTHYTSHVMQVSSKPNARLESKYVGNALKIDNEVLQLLLN